MTASLEIVGFYAKSLFENSGQEFPDFDKLGHAFGAYLGLFLAQLFEEQHSQLDCFPVHFPNRGVCLLDFGG